MASNSKPPLPDESFDVWDGTIGTLPTPVNDVYYISTSTELMAYKQLIETRPNGLVDARSKAILTKNLDLADIAMTGIAYESNSAYRGTFDGNGHTIKGIRIIDTVSASSLTQSSGFFSYIAEKCMIKNLTIQGRIDGQHENQANIVGGLVGTMSNGNILNCVVDMELSGNNGTYYMGGICGLMEGHVATIKNSVFKGTVANNASTPGIPMCAGGIIGVYTGLDKTACILEMCTNEGNILAYDVTLVNIGGIIGYIFDERHLGTIRFNSSIGKLGDGSNLNNIGGVIGGTVFNSANQAVAYNYYYSPDGNGNNNNWNATGVIMQCNGIQYTPCVSAILNTYAFEGVPSWFKCSLHPINGRYSNFFANVFANGTLIGQYKLSQDGYQLLPFTETDTSGNIYIQGNDIPTFPNAGNKVGEFTIGGGWNQ